MVSLQGAVRLSIQEPLLRTRAAVLALIAWLAGSGPVAAQASAQTGLELTSSESMWPHVAEVRRRPLAAAALPRFSQPAQRRSRDSLRNGAMTGAVVGAVGLGGLAALTCHLHQEEGGASCLPDTLGVAAIGAAIGTGVGVAVDAALTRHHGVAVGIRVKF